MSRRHIIAVALFIAVTAAAFGPIRNYDLFWHLATGRWIVEHRALPLTDPFAVASDREPWINGEWLFQIGAFGAEAAVGIAGLSLLRALLIAALFTIVFLFAARDSADHVALALTALAFAGGMATLDFRPASIAALFVALAIVVARANTTVAFALLTVVWINVHPSALLAPIIAAIVTRRPLMPAVSFATLFVNPFGWRAVAAPLTLLRFVGSGEFVNAEWLPSPPAVFPLLYITIAIAAAAFAVARERREHLWRLALMILFAALAIRSVRHQPLWFAAFPLLAAPMLRSVRLPRVAVYAASAALIGWISWTADHRAGVSPSRFPLQAVARLRASGLRGNIYNPDQFGGFLIWSFYPERRALTDGRNELYRAFIPEYARARRDGRAWSALLRRYRIDLAVDEYRPPLEVRNAVTNEVTRMPASLAYWPRRRWALIAYDDAAMVFARRAAFPRETIEKLEIRGVVPDARP